MTPLFSLSYLLIVLLPSAASLPLEEDVVNVWSSETNTQPEDCVVGWTLRSLTSWLPSFLVSTDKKHIQKEKPTQPNSEDITKKIIDYVDPDSIASLLRNLTYVPHLAGTEQDLKQAEYIRDLFVQMGMDEVSIVPYEVLLSYPEKHIPNKIHLLNKDGGVEFTTSGVQPPLYAPEEHSKLVYPNFNGYSGTGEVEGELVYVNYGRKDDFKYLKSKGINVKGKIVIAKYGKIFRGNIARFAQDYGAVGVILFSDPKDFAQDGRDSVYPNTVWMPGMAVQVGTVKNMGGDPLTPLYPSVESAFRLKEESADIPKIPVQPIGYDEAEVLLRNMQGDLAPNNWQGALNCTYHLGPGHVQGQTIKMDIKTRNKRVKTYNVIATFKGALETDRYVLVGNHRDSWSMFGAIDPLSATATSLEIARVLTKINRETGWRPRRSVVFCSWGAEEYGLVGSTEWVEEHMTILNSRAVAYLNVDLAVEGNVSLRALAVPLLHDLLYDSAKKIPNPNPEEVNSGRPTVYDTWLHYRPDGDKPSIGSLGSSSDYGSFIHYLGVPSADIRYTYTEDINSYPLYHTLYETFHVMKDLYDKGFHYSATVSRMWGEMIRSLADSTLLPFSVANYGNYVQTQAENFISNYGNLLQKHRINIDWFHWAASNFSSVAQTFQENLKHIDEKDFYKVQRVNNQITQLEKAFIEPRGLPGRPAVRHVVFAPSSKDSYVGSSFSGLTDILGEIEETGGTDDLWELFEQHLSVVTYLINCATQTLQDSVHNRRI